jgi:hypothetical protein
MLYVTETKKDVETAARDLEEAVKCNKFGVLHVHDLQRTDPAHRPPGALSRSPRPQTSSRGGGARDDTDD